MIISHFECQQANKLFRIKGDLIKPYFFFVWYSKIIKVFKNQILYLKFEYQHNYMALLKRGVPSPVYQVFIIACDTSVQLGTLNGKL